MQVKETYVITYTDFGGNILKKEVKALSKLDARMIFEITTEGNHLVKKIQLKEDIENECRNDG